MKNKYKTYLKLNLVSVFFIAVSFISISLAWFAYSGMVRTGTEIDVKAWHIEFDKNGQAVSNSVVISLDDIQPGMKPLYEKINIKNYGDSEAKISYKIEQARILDEDLKIPLEFGQIEDKFSNDYPFSINVNLNKKYIEAKTGEAQLNIAVTWPLDSDNDEEDSKWGNLAYEYQQTHKDTPSIKIVITIKAEQNTDNISYNSGDIVLYDVINNVKCDKMSDSCKRMHILNPNYDESEDFILLPDLYETYGSGTYNEYDSLLTSTWNVELRSLRLNDILNLISEDLDNSYLIRNNLSDKLIGYIGYNNRIDKYIKNVVNPYESYFKFDNSKYSFLSLNKCIWIKDKYDDNNSFAIVNDSTKGNMIKPYNISNNCEVIPVVIVPKYKLYE